MRFAGIWSLLVLTGLPAAGGGCSSLSSTEPACPVEARTFTVAYGGDAAGVGRLKLVPQEAGTYAVTAELLTQAEGGKGWVPAMRLQGPGACSGGILHARFGGATSEDSTIRILGGKLEGVASPSLVDTEFFAAWSMDIIHKASGKREVIQGVLRQREQVQPVGEELAGRAATK